MIARIRVDEVIIIQADVLFEPIRFVHICHWVIGLSINWIGVSSVPFYQSIVGMNVTLVCLLLKSVPLIRATRHHVRVSAICTSVRHSYWSTDDRFDKCSWRIWVFDLHEHAKWIHLTHSTVQIVWSVIVGYARILISFICTQILLKSDTAVESVIMYFPFPSWFFIKVTSRLKKWR